MKISEMYAGYCDQETYSVVVWFTPDNGPEFTVNVTFKRSSGEIIECSAARDFESEVAPHLESLWEKYMRNPERGLPPELQVCHVHEIKAETAILEIAKAAARDYYKSQPAN